MSTCDISWQEVEGNLPDLALPISSRVDCYQPKVGESDFLDLDGFSTGCLAPLPISVVDTHDPRANAFPGRALNIKRGVLSLLAISCFLPLVQGCATVLSDRQYPVTFENAGAPTYFAVRDQKNELVHQGVTPQQVTLSAHASPFRRAKYDVTFAGTGEHTQQHQLKAGVDPWIAANLVLGGVVGAIVDGATGAMWKLPERVTGGVPAQFAVAEADRGASIAATQSATQSATPKVSDPDQSDMQQVEYQATLDTGLPRR